MASVCGFRVSGYFRLVFMFCVSKCVRSICVVVSKRPWLRIECCVCYAGDSRTYAKKSNPCGIALCGERGIRTPGTSQCGSFQDCCNRPLYHLSRRPLWAAFLSKAMQRYGFFPKRASISVKKFKNSCKTTVFTAKTITLHA